MLSKVCVPSMSKERAKMLWIGEICYFYKSEANKWPLGNSRYWRTDSRETLQLCALCTRDFESSFSACAFLGGCW